MDALHGNCWHCKKDEKNIFCKSCSVAVYCSADCRNLDRMRHVVECLNVLWLKSCHACHIQKPLLKRCSGCYNAMYCSEQCQRSQWPNHKKRCKVLKSLICKHALAFEDQDVLCMPRYIGKHIAENYLHLENNEGAHTSTTLKLLFLGVDDLRDIIKTVTDLPANHAGGLKFVINNISPHIMARNVLFIYMVLKDTEVCHLVQLYYSAKISVKNMKCLILALETLIRLQREKVIEELGNVLEIGESSWNNMKDVWAGWLKLASDRSACSKLVNFRTELNNEQPVQLMYNCFLKTVPRRHVDSVKDFCKKGLLLPLRAQEREKAILGNPLMACFNPYKTPYCTKYPDICAFANPEGKLRKKISDFDDMIYFAEDATLVFKSWDYLEVRKLISFKNDVVHMFKDYLELIFKNFASHTQRGKTHFHFIVDTFQNLDHHLNMDETFDRISLGKLGDIFPITPLLRQFGPRLNKDNKHSVLITQHENWKDFVETYDSFLFPSEEEIRAVTLSDIHNRPELLAGIPASDRHTAAKTFSYCAEDYTNSHLPLFYHVLAKLLAGKYPSLNKAVLEKGSLLHPSDVASESGLCFRDYRVELNHVIPFQREGNIRRLSKQINRVRYLEWPISVK